MRSPAAREAAASACSLIQHCRHGQELLRERSLQSHSFSWPVPFATRGTQRLVAQVTGQVIAAKNLHAALPDVRQSIATELAERLLAADILFARDDGSV